MTIIIFLIVLAVLIFVHELGHFLAARAFGIRVDAFKIGFGPKVVYWKKGETEYGLNLIPFGGFVKIFGEDPNAESTHGPDATRSFVHKARWKQVVCLAAGVLFNFIFAAILYAIVFMSGFTASPEGLEQYSNLFTNERIMITSVAADSPAAQANLKPGDTILYVETTAMNQEQNGTKAPGTAVHIPPAKQTVEEIQHVIATYGGKPVAIAYEREGHTNIIGVTPTDKLVPGKYAIGIGMGDAVDLKLPFFSAVKEGFVYTGILIKDTVVGIYGLIANIFRGQPDFSQVTGVVGIYGIVADAQHMGWTYLLMITAIISINLGVINLVPFPALDGGRILFVLIEGVTRRRIPAKVANMTNLVGFALLMILMVLVTWRDIARLIRA
ncbi:MAG TPA: site-2 protease family protein [Candidatus Paceibacterota bacterium]